MFDVQERASDAAQQRKRQFGQRELGGRDQSEGPNSYGIGQLRRRGFRRRIGSGSRLKTPANRNIQLGNQNTLIGRHGCFDTGGRAFIVRCKGSMSKVTNKWQVSARTHLNAYHVFFIIGRKLRFFSLVFLPIKIGCQNLSNFSWLAADAIWAESLISSAVQTAPNPLYLKSRPHHANILYIERLRILLNPLHRVSG